MLEQNATMDGIPTTASLCRRRLLLFDLHLHLLLFLLHLLDEFENVEDLVQRDVVDGKRLLQKVRDLKDSLKTPLPPPHPLTPTQRAIVAIGESEHPEMRLGVLGDDLPAGRGFAHL